MASFKGMQFGVGSALGSALNFMRNRKQQRNILDEARKAAQRENQRAENLGFEEQTTLGEEPVFETEPVPIQAPNASLQVERLPLQGIPSARNRAMTLDVNNPDSVRAFQQAYNDETGSNIAVDGVLGPITEGALRNVQGQNNRISTYDFGALDERIISPGGINATVDEEEEDVIDPGKGMTGRSRVEYLKRQGL